jgi:hypothetical protein
MTIERVLDAAGERFYIGARVHLVGEQPVDEALGSVTEVTDVDGDMVDGQTVGIMPRVLVTFDDGSDEEYPAQMRHPDDDFRVDDLMLLPCPTCKGTMMVGEDPTPGIDRRDPRSEAQSLDCPTCQVLS